MVDIATLVMRVDALEVKAAAKETDNLSRAAVGAEKSASAMTATYVNVDSILKRIAASYAAIKLVDYIRDSTMLAARYETLGISLHTAGRNAGYASGQMDEYQRALEKTGISMIESRNTLIQMSAANMDLANATKLARAAQDLAVVGNVNSSESFNRLVYGIKSGQTEILRTLGLNVQFEESYKTLAAQLHKNVAALTEQEKMQARTNIVMEAATQYAGIYEAAMGTSAKQLSSLARYHDNLQVVMGSTFTEALAMAVAAYTGELKDLNAEAQDLKVKGDLKEFGRVTALTLAVVADSARMAANAIIITGVSLAKLGLYAKIANKPWADSVDADKASIAELTAIQADAMAGMADNLKVYNAVSSGFARNDEEDAQRKQKKLTTDARFAAQSLMIMEAYANDSVAMREKLAGLADVYGGDYAAQYGTRKAVGAPAGESKGVADARKKSHDDELRDIRQSALEAQKIYADLDPTYNASLAWEKYMELVKGGYLDLAAAGQAYAKEFGKEDVIAAEKSAKAIADAHEKEAKRAQQSWERFTGNIQRTFGDVLYNGLNGGFKNIGDAFKQMTLRMMADAAAANLTNALFGGEKGGGVMGKIGGAIGDFFTPSFAGGGFTGNEPRSGGLDGQGGFLAMMHPQEDVYDRTKGQAAGAAVTVVQHINIDSRSDASVIIAAMTRAKDMAKAEIMNSLQRGGDFAAAVGRA